MDGNESTETQFAPFFHGLSSALLNSPLLFPTKDSDQSLATLKPLEGSLGSLSPRLPYYCHL
jgi:hypothetical protein